MKLCRAICRSGTGLPPRTACCGARSLPRARPCRWMPYRPTARWLGRCGRRCSLIRRLLRWVARMAPSVSSTTCCHFPSHRNHLRCRRYPSSLHWRTCDAVAMLAISLTLSPPRPSPERYSSTLCATPHWRLVTALCISSLSRTSQNRWSRPGQLPVLRLAAHAPRRYRLRPTRPLSGWRPNNRTAY